MSDNLFEARYDLTKKSRLRQFYESNKISIFAFIFAAKSIPEDPFVSYLGKGTSFDSLLINIFVIH